MMATQTRQRRTVEINDGWFQMGELDNLSEGDIIIYKQKRELVIQKTRYEMKTLSRLERDPFIGGRIKLTMRSLGYDLHNKTVEFSVDSIRIRMEKNGRSTGLYSIDDELLTGAGF